MAITVYQFSKIFRGSMPPDPLESFLFLNLLEINTTEKNKLEKTFVASPKKILNAPLT